MKFSKSDCTNVNTNFHTSYTLLISSLSSSREEGGFVCVLEHSILGLVQLFGSQMYTKFTPRKSMLASLDTKGAKLGKMCFKGPLYTATLSTLLASTRKGISVQQIVQIFALSGLQSICIKSLTKSYVLS